LLRNYVLYWHMKCGVKNGRNKLISLPAVDI
jgi:hypothetical protein